MKCSVIIPYFQRKELLLKTLRALDQQDFGHNDFEIILVDDGSNDLKVEEISELLLSISVQYFRFERNTDSCAAMARNRGIEKAKGDILLFLDCDIIVRQDFVRHHCELHLMYPELKILQIGLRNYLKPGIDTMEFYKPESYWKDERVELFQIHSHNMGCLQGAWNLCFSCNISIRKSVVMKYGAFDADFKGWGLEDTEFAYRLQEHGVHIVYNPNIEVYHQFHEANFDQSRYKNWKENLMIFERKHNKLQVKLQEIFCDYFDPEIRESLYEQGIHNVWERAFNKFEAMLKVLEGVPSLDSAGRITLTDPDIEMLVGHLEKAPEKGISVICSDQRVEELSWIQIYAKNVHLFLY